MDEFLEQMLSTSSWGDGVSLNRASWDATTVSSGTGLSIDPTGGLQGLPKNSTIPTMPSAPLVGRQENQVLNRAPQDQGNGGGHVGENTECLPGKGTLSPQFQHRDGLFESSQGQPQDAANISLQKFSEGRATGVKSSVLQLNANVSPSLPSIGCPPRGPPMLKNNTFEGSGFQQTTHNLQGSTLMAPTWRQPYIGSVPPLPSALSQGNPDTFSLRGEAISNEVNLGKRSRDEEDYLRESHPVSRLHVAQQGQGVQHGQGHGDQSPLPQNPAGNAANGAARPRVRARRGQATDPHSIAERNRRERIAERMKALQELVPDSNKTDKASMLDEIIGYVKFLQMQVKCLSMCRLGGAGAAAPLFDLPAEGAGNFIAASLAQANGAPGPSQDGIAFAERQVARLMDEDMSAAMQYLQSKGLCLMPISLATAISSTGARQQSTSIKGSDNGGNETQAMELQVAAATGSTNPVVMATLANSGVSPLGNDGIVKSGGNTPKTLRDMPKDENMNE